MKSIRPILNLGGSLLGIQGIIGIGLILFSLGLYSSSVAPGKERIALLLGKTDRLQRAAGTTVDASGAHGPLSDFYNFFPQLDTLPGALDKIYRLAEHEGLDLPKGEYRFAADTQERITAYQAVFPVKGTYVQVRRFAVAVLNELPFASLDDLRLAKQRSADPTVESQIKLTFYFRSH